MAPHSAMELGLTHLSLDELSDARLWLDRARRDYSGYLLETIVHFRVHCAMRSIKAKANQLTILASEDTVLETALEAHETETELNNSGLNTRISSMFTDLSKKMNFTSISGSASPLSPNRTQEYEEFLDGYQNKL